MRYILCLCVIVVVNIATLTARGAPPAGAAATSAEKTGQAPKLNIPEVALRGTLLKIHEDQIRARLRFFAAMMRNAKDGDQKTIDEARKGFISTYEFSDSITFRYTTAKIVTDEIAPLLDLPNPTKQINTALAMSKMSQVTIQPALEKMVAHSNAAVRYLGWRGYQASWVGIVGQGDVPAGKMFASLDKWANREQSAPVMAAIWDTLRIASEQAVTTVAVNNARKRSVEILIGSWPRQCRKVLNGDTAMADAAGKGVTTAIKYAAIYAVSNGSDKENVKETVQLSADMMWCAAKAYVAAYEKAYKKPDESADDKALRDADKKARVNASVQANENLLLKIEKLLNNDLLHLEALSKKGYLRHPLSDASAWKERPSAVLVYARRGKTYGIYSWIDELKSRFGIHNVDAKAFEPATAPAAATTRPAGTP